MIRLEASTAIKSLEDGGSGRGQDLNPCQANIGEQSLDCQTLSLNIVQKVALFPGLLDVSWPGSGSAVLPRELSGESTRRGNNKSKMSRMHGPQEHNFVPEHQKKDGMVGLIS